MRLLAASSRSRGFTLIEVMVSTALAMIVMAAVFSTYLYLGRNLTRLSYRSTLESQSRKILNTFAADIRNTKAIKATSDTGSGSSRVIELFLILHNTDASKGTVPTMEVTYKYSYDTTENIWIFTRDPDGNALPKLPLKLNYIIGDSNVRVPISMLLPADNRLFTYTTASGNTYTTTGTGPTYQTTTTLVPMSIKQVAIGFILQAGTAAIQGLQGTQSTYQVASGRMPLVNHSLPDGS